LLRSCDLFVRSFCFLKDFPPSRSPAFFPFTVLFYLEALRGPSLGIPLWVTIPFFNGRCSSTGQGHPPDRAALSPANCDVFCLTMALSSFYNPPPPPHQMPGGTVTRSGFFPPDPFLLILELPRLRGSLPKIAIVSARLRLVCGGRFFFFLDFADSPCPKPKHQIDTLRFLEPPPSVSISPPVGYATP